MSVLHQYCNSVCLQTGNIIQAYGRYVFWTLLQASNLSDPSVMEKKDPGHRMLGRLSNCLAKLPPSDQLDIAIDAA